MPRDLLAIQEENRALKRQLLDAERGLKQYVPPPGAGDPADLREGGWTVGKGAGTASSGTPGTASAPRTPHPAGPPPPSLLSPPKAVPHSLPPLHEAR